MTCVFDFALTTAAFIILGLVIDRAVGTRPLFTIGLTVLAFTGQFIRAWFQYDADMKRLEAELPSRKQAR